MDSAYRLNLRQGITRRAKMSNDSAGKWKIVAVGFGLLAWIGAAVEYPLIGFALSPILLLVCVGYRFHGASRDRVNRLFKVKDAKQAGTRVLALAGVFFFAIIASVAGIQMRHEEQQQAKAKAESAAKVKAQRARQIKQAQALAAPRAKKLLQRAKRLIAEAQQQSESRLPQAERLLQQVVNFRYAPLETKQAARVLLAKCQGITRMKHYHRMVLAMTPRELRRYQRTGKAPSKYHLRDPVFNAFFLQQLGKKKRQAKAIREELLRKVRAAKAAREAARAARLAKAREKAMIPVLHKELKGLQLRSIFIMGSKAFKRRYGLPVQTTKSGDYAYYYYRKADTTVQVHLSKRLILNIYKGKFP